MSPGQRLPKASGPSPTPAFHFCLEIRISRAEEQGCPVGAGRSRTAVLCVNFSLEKMEGSLLESTCPRPPLCTLGCSHTLLGSCCRELRLWSDPTPSCPHTRSRVCTSGHMRVCLCHMRVSFHTSQCAQLLSNRL